jgi:hypothetical protein
MPIAWFNRVQYPLSVHSGRYMLHKSKAWPLALTFIQIVSSVSFSKAVVRSTMYHLYNKWEVHRLSYYDPFWWKKSSEISSLLIFTFKWDSVTQNISYSSAKFWRKCNLFLTLLMFILHMEIYWSTLLFSNVHRCIRIIRTRTRMCLYVTYY